MLQDLKDKALAKAIHALAAEKFHAYGEVQDVDIDTGRNRLVLRALLKGEDAPITATVDRYEIEKTGGEVYLVIHQLSASREWLSKLLDKIGIGKRFKIPGPVAMLL